MPGSAFNLMFTLVPLFIGIVFVIVIGSIIVNVGKNVAQWSENNAQPRLTQEATVVAKRTEVSGSQNHSSTSYYLTFELPDGGRREFSVTGSEYGLQAEGDNGQLEFQGTRYLSFTRSMSRAAQAREAEQTPPPANLICSYCGSAIPAGTRKCGGCGSSWRPPTSQPGEA